jgi:hypothetical protein
VTAKLGFIWNSDALLLRSANQLERYGSSQEISQIEEVKLRMRVKFGEDEKTYEIVNDMIAKDPANPDLYVLRANIYRSDGKRKSAIDDLVKARGIIASGSWRETFTASVDEIDEWLKQLREEDAQDK